MQQQRVNMVAQMIKKITAESNPTCMELPAMHGVRAASHSMDVQTEL